MLDEYLAMCFGSKYQQLPPVYLAALRRAYDNPHTLVKVYAGWYVVWDSDGDGDMIEFDNQREETGRNEWVIRSCSCKWYDIGPRLRDLARRYLRGNQ